MEKCEKELNELSFQNNYDEGSSGKALAYLQNMELKIFEKLKNEKLLDVPFDDEPLHIFMYHAGRYFALNVIRNCEKGDYKRFFDNPTLSNNNKLTHEKESLLRNRLETCMNILNVMNIKASFYPQAVKEVVLLNIRQLIEDNHVLCSTYKKSDGALEEYMKKAVSDITGEKNLIKETEVANELDSKVSSDNLAKGQEKNTEVKEKSDEIDDELDCQLNTENEHKSQLNL